MVNKYSAEQLQWLFDNRTLTFNPLVEAFNARFAQNKTAIALASYRKRKGCLTGRTGQFNPGHIPFNAGTKGLSKINSGSFAIGNIPANFKSVGSERIEKDGYIAIKIKDPNKWRYKHILNWTKANGKIPPGKIIRFKDSNKLNCNLDNLELISQAEHLRLNALGYSHMPAELKPTVMALAKLQTKTFEISANYTNR